jgi:uncharacterized delta-60 repeat protein
MACAIACGGGGDDTSPPPGADGGPDAPPGPPPVSPNDAGDGGDGGPVLANDVPLDPSFGKNGVVTFADDTVMYDQSAAIVRQPDGKLLVLASTGEPDYGYCTQAFVTRYTTTGAVDTTFGTNGRAVLPVARFPWALTLLLQADGKIVVGGATRIAGPVNYFDHAFIARLLPTGALDPAFGGAGVIETKGNTGTVALAPGGAILQVSTSATGFDLARYDATGTLDATFGTAGVVHLATATFGNAPPSNVVVESDGKIWIAGSDYNFNAKATVIRLLANGAFDTTLDGDGRLDTAPTGSVDTHVAGFLLQPDGTFLIGGAAYVSSNVEVAFIAKYTSAGVLDTTFAGGTGVHTEATAQVDNVAHMARLDDGRIAYAGEIATQIRVGRLLANGTPDPAFQGGALATPGLTGGGPVLVGLAVDPATGKSYPFGDVSVVTASENAVDTRIVGLAADGSLDTAFGTAGTSLSNSGFAKKLASSILPIASGGVFVVERSAQSGHAAVHRLDAAGAPVASFGSGGAARVDGQLHIIAGMALSSAGKPIVLGQPSAGFGVTAVALDPATGALDASFGTGGVFARTTGAPYATSIAVDDSGRVLLAAKNTGSQSELTRLTPAGAPDTAFNTTGTLGLMSTFDYEADVHLATAPGGKIVMASTAQSKRVSVVRLTSNAAVEASYTMPTKMLEPAYVSDVAVLADGSVVVAGYSDTNDPKAVKGAFLVKLTPNLVLDATFGTGGVIVEATPTEPPDAPGYQSPFFSPSVTPLASGGFMLACATIDRLHEVTWVWRFDAAGKLDTTYATAGKGTLVDVGILGFGRQPDGKVLAAGRTWSTGIAAWAARLE